MAKKTVTQLSKDLSVDRAKVMEALEKLGRSRVTTRSAVNDEDIGKIRSMLGLADASKIKVGEERVTVTSRAGGQETVTDRRVQGTVIRRRRVVKATPETAAPGAPLPGGGGESLPPPPPPAPDLPGETAPPPMPAELPETSVEAKKPEPTAPPEEEEPAVQEPKPEPVAPEAREPEPPEAGEEPRAEREEAPEPQPEAREKTPAEEEPAIVGAEREETEGPKVLGRIDLRKTEEPERPSSKEGLADVSTGRDTKGRREEKGGRRRKLKVIKKDVSDVDRLYRPGRYPKKRRALPGKEQKKTEITTPKASKRIIRMGEAISVGDLARQMGIKAGDVLKKLIEMGVMATINQTLDHDTASVVASEFDYKVESTAFDAESAIEEVHEAEEVDEAKQPRPPVVTVMGHVDHGKTSLLDMIRKANVVSGEAGGITQHIGAYSVVQNDRQITFIDTPGHEAFTAMRARGAKVTDIVILVVAADDGVMPQTIEAINHAKAAKVPLVVAINKIDKPGADPERARRELSEHGLIPEDWGGDATMVPVSAVTLEGIPDLLEMVLLQADILELKANPDKLARGIIVEAKLERGRGPVATVLVQEGTLRAGDPFVCGTQYGRVRAMVDENRRQVKEAGPARPVEILGLQGVPGAGDLFTAVKDDTTAKQVAEHRESKKRDAQLAASQRTSLDELYAQMKSQQVKELKVIVKADVQGSVEALQDALQRLSTEEARVNIIHASVGGVSESDVLLASASDAVILGFNIRPETKAQALAEREGVQIRLYRVIYEALQELHKALEGLLEPEIREEVIGRAEVRQTFSVSGAGTIAGSFVVDGKVHRNARVRLLRDNVVVHQGKVASLKRFKDDAREVAAGYECGIGLQNYNDIKTGDVLEFFETQEVARRLEIPKDQGTSAAERSA